MPMENPELSNDSGLPFPMLFVEPESEPPIRLPTLDPMELVARISGKTRPTGKRDKILVLHSIGIRDVHAVELVAELARRGAPVYYFHTDAFLRACRLSIMLGPSGRPHGLLEMPTGDLALDEVKSVWFRGPGIALSDPPGQTGESADFVRRETEAALFGLLGVLDQAFWVNRPDAVHAAEDKLAQLVLAQALGLLIPRTLVSNDPERVRDFFESCGGEVIIKTFRRLAFHQNGQERLILTNRVQREHLAHIERVRHAPCLFQEYVPKDVELRVTVIGKRIFAAEIHSQQSPISRDDYRRYDFAHTPYYPHTLPPAIEAACLRLLDRYGLAFAALDLIRRPDGAYVFIEINANAQFLWVQDLTGLPMREALADMLIRGALDE
jgi:glutathione synthase/RimK-type ligase-like ATP-grasp enzyme